MRTPTEGDEPRGEMPPWIFPDRRVGEPYDHKVVRVAFARFAKAAGLTQFRFSPKSLRHTYASQMLAMGWSPAYVQEQLGHATIEMTVTTYGRWLRKRAPGAVDMLNGAFSGALAGHAGYAKAADGASMVDLSDYRSDADASLGPSVANPYLNNPKKDEEPHE